MGAVGYRGLVGAVGCEELPHWWELGDGLSEGMAPVAGVGSDWWEQWDGHGGGHNSPGLLPSPVGGRGPSLAPPLTWQASFWPWA